MTSGPAPAIGELPARLPGTAGSSRLSTLGLKQEPVQFNGHSFGWGGLFLRGQAPRGDAGEASCFRCACHLSCSSGALYACSLIMRIWASAGCGGKRPGFAVLSMLLQQRCAQILFPHLEGQGSSRPWAYSIGRGGGLQVPRSVAHCRSHGDNGQHGVRFVVAGQLSSSALPSSPSGSAASTFHWILQAFRCRAPTASVPFLGRRHDRSRSFVSVSRVWA